MAFSKLTLHRYKRRNKAYTEELGNGVTLTLMLIPGSEFMMGAPKDEKDSLSRERPQHRVQMPQFLMGRYPITQAQWRVVAGYKREKRDLDPEPSRFNGDRLPIEQVSWEDATEFCQRLARKTGKQYQLPNEAQWEYACRANTQTPFFYGEVLTPELATYRWPDKQARRQQTTEVGSYPANDWGLHDMHGNVWEWCEDDWHGSYDGAPVDGSAWVDDGRKDSSKVLRGGSWDDYPGHCRSASRDGYSRVNRDCNIGFRVCCVLPRLSS